MVFYYEFSTVPFIRKDTIPPNWTDIVKRSSKSSAPENIDLNDNWFTPDLEEDPRKNTSREPTVAPENNRNTPMLSQYVPHIQVSPDSKGSYVSEVNKHSASGLVCNTSNLNLKKFAQ